MTMVMKREIRVSKSKMKARALEFFRDVESSGRPIVITDRGRPVLKLVPYRPDPAESLRALRDTVVRYEAPLEPIGIEDWESL